MSTSYVDVNARNSKIERPVTNNIWEFNLPETVELPTGTEISVQNALINLQGITGASIEIEEDIEESIMFQYYLSDSTYEAPNREIAPDLTKITSFNIYSRMDQHYHFNTFHPITYPNFKDVGWSENIMPLVCNYELTKPSGSVESNTMPFCGEAKIKIKKGIYSISKIATLISDQINLVTNPENENNLITEAKLSNSYTGLLYNQTTNRAARVEPEGFWLATVPTGEPQTPYVSAQAVKPLTFNTFTNPLSFVAVTNNFNEEIRDEIKQGNWGNDQNQEQKFEYFTANPQPNRKYFIGFEAVNGPTPYDGNQYNVFSQNSMGIGTSSFNIGYSTTDSAFTIQNLHEPRRLPTHDRFGNVVKNAGQSCAYLKRVPTTFVPDGASQISTLNSPVQRYSGITIYNWGWETAKRLGIKWRTKTNANLPDDDVDDASKFATFGEFFASKADAEAAWATTIWARLGFSYDDIQDPTSFTEQRFFDELPETTNGFTTRQEVDASAIPYISTIFNGAQGGVGSTEAPKATGSQIEPLPQSIASIQNFNLLDVNVPNLGYNNNKNVNPAIAPAIAVVAPYQASFYRDAVMIPIQTKGRDVTASNLPILSENGYLYILSDLIEPNDIVKYKDNVGLLDQLPKSNLSNQDFIADRTAIVHTLTNPKLINSIRIMVLNPDLRDVNLQLNSSILLKITKPKIPPTIFQSNIENNTNDEVKEGELQKSIAEKQKAQTKEDAMLGVEQPQAQATTTASDIAETAALAIEAPPAKKKTTKPRKPRQKKIKE
jgi:hypothetical protein